MRIRRPVAHEKPAHHSNESAVARTVAVVNDSATIEVAKHRRRSPGRRPAAATEALSRPEAFAAWGICETLLDGLAHMGISTPSEIQAAMAKPVLEGRDVVGQARTGTGKTLA